MHSRTRAFTSGSVCGAYPPNRLGAGAVIPASISRAFERSHPALKLWLRSTPRAFAFQRSWLSLIARSTQSLYFPAVSAPCRAISTPSGLTHGTNIISRRLSAPPMSIPHMVCLFFALRHSRSINLSVTSAVSRSCAWKHAAMSTGFALLPNRRANIFLPQVLRPAISTFKNGYSAWSEHTLFFIYA